MLSEQYNQIVDFITNYQGLSIECDLSTEFPDVPAITLRSIQSKIGQNIIKSFYYKNYNKAQLILQE
jgi:predicted small integral membrane protein